MSLTTTAGLVAYFQHEQAASATHSTAPAAVAVSTATSPSPAATAATAATSPAETASPPTSAATTSAAPTASTTSSSAGFADGTYTGDVDTNRWGPVQVQIVVAGGEVTDAVALQTPDVAGKSVSINRRAAPLLATEALAAQSAEIDTVSGATYTSGSYRASLQSALDQARAAAVQTGAP